MRTNKADKGIRGFGLRRALAGLVLAGAVLSAATGAEAAVKFKKSCQDMLSSSDMQDIEDAAWLLEDHFDEIVDYTNLDPWDEGFRYFDGALRSDLRKEVEELRDGKIWLRCKGINEGGCDLGPDGSGVHAYTGREFAHDMSFDGVTICPAKIFQDGVAGVAGTLVHELTHHIGSERHRGFCTEQVVTTDSDFTDLFGIPVREERQMTDPSGRLFRCKKDNRKNIKEQCPASNNPVSCEDIGKSMLPVYSTNLDGAAPNAAETIGYTAERLLSVIDVSVKVTGAKATGGFASATAGDFDVRLWFEVENHGFVPVEFEASVTGPSANLSCDPVLDPCDGLGGKPVKLAPGQSWQGAVHLSGHSAASAVEKFRVVLNDPGSSDPVLQHAPHPDPLVYHLEKPLYPDRESWADEWVAMTDTVEVPLQILASPTAKANSGKVCGAEPGPATMQSELLAWIRAEEKLDARLAHQCFGGDKPSDFNGFGGSPAWPHGTTWNDVCADMCEFEFPAEAIQSASAKVIDKSVAILSDTEIQNACGASGSFFDVSKGASQAYSAWEIRLKGSGTCGCSCEFD